MVGLARLTVVRCSLAIRHDLTRRTAPREREAVPDMIRRALKTG